MLRCDAAKVAGNSGRVVPSIVRDSGWENLREGELQRQFDRKAQVVCKVAVLLAVRGLPGDG